MNSNSGKKILYKLRPQGFLVDRARNEKRSRYFKRCSRMDLVQKGFNWKPRGRFIKDTQVRIFAAIHYLTEHAPAAVQKRWETAAERWRKRMKSRRSNLLERL